MGGSLVWPLIRFLLAFAVVLVLAAVVSRAVARRARGFGGSPFRLLGGLSLGPGRQLCAVQVGRRVLVLGLGDKQVRLVDRITDADEVAALLDPGPEGVGALNGFDGFLARALGRGRPGTGGASREG